jgi:hypothetical protein
MFCLWGIQHKWESNEVLINRKGVRLLIWVHSGSLVPALVSKYQPYRLIEILSVAVNPGVVAPASEYGTVNWGSDNEITNDKWTATS